MRVIIGSARIDERGKAYGGKAGDQKQVAIPDFRGEVSMQDFYESSSGWIVARLKSDSQAMKCARRMETACNNKHLGYDQWQRDGVHNEGTSSKKDIEGDCSRLVGKCIEEATGVDVGNIRTITMEKTLSKHKDIFKPLIQYKPGMTLYTGDILFTGKLGHPVSGHTVIVVSGKTRSNSEVALYNLRKGSVGDEVLKLQKNLNALGYKDDNRKPLVEDGDFGSKTEQALKKFQKSAGIKIDGVYNKEDYNVMKYAINHK